MGYHRAGFDVTGVDVESQPHFPFHFIQADALTFPLDGFDVVHAGPPCQRYARVTRWRGRADAHPDLLPRVLERLQNLAVPWVIENVPEAIPYPDLVLCGSSFGLAVRRHRHFLTSWPIFGLMAPCHHDDLLPFIHKGERAYADALGCEWMNKYEARQAIPTRYTEWIGGRIMELPPNDSSGAP
jgi:DNA (cytosine-5)-methyltransferase 1